MTSDISKAFIYGQDVGIPDLTNSIFSCAVFFFQGDPSISCLVSGCAAPPFRLPIISCKIDLLKRASDLSVRLKYVEDSEGYETSIFQLCSC